jgi:formylglycine-generating enzyme required for sulfatase activity
VVLQDTPTDTLIDEPTQTPLNTPNETEIEATIQQQMILLQTQDKATGFAGETQTATHFTATPTLDLEGTARARLTATQMSVNQTTTQNSLNATATQDRIVSIAIQNQVATLTATHLTPPPTATFTLTYTPTYTPTPKPGTIAVTHNADWSPVERIFEDGIPMVLVPVGCFEMGSTTGYSNEQPVETICFDEPFWIDKTEVSQADFARLGGQKAYSSRFNGDSLPIERITWFEAKAFCEARGARLPTEAEWEYAARGPDSLVYPWGNQFNRSLVNYCDVNCTFSWADRNFNDGYKNTAPVGSYLEGKSWVGALDMSGNVWEWVNTIYGQYPYATDDGREAGNDNMSHILRGGSFNNPTDNVRAVYRYHRNPDLVDFDLGFRCVR